MGKPKQSPHPDAEQKSASETRESPLSLNRLREAFATMLGGGSQESSVESQEPDAIQSAEHENGSLCEPASQACEINPRRQCAA
jgi:hypothetical protein